MSADQMTLLSNISFVLAVLFLLLAIIMFFIIKIPQVIGDVSGINERKAIESIQQGNKTENRRKYNADIAGKLKGKITEEIYTPQNVVVSDETTLLNETETVFSIEQEIGFCGSSEIIK
ncbi:MAG: hypothetical protein ACK5LL_16190 [Suipraeoptans sp.]